MNEHHDIDDTQRAVSDERIGKENLDTPVEEVAA